ncbi:MAG TPA: protein translocase subunit SecD [Bryobacteraceae bacterium]|jgi:preprotein translocase subunit SecD|nr:protein translocase subunit SecD [Bryobacteraceae bacterium]
MQRNLNIKAAVIVVIILACLFGIIGFPKFMGGVGIPTSLPQLSANMRKNIHLGLDLIGGSHLVLQVQVQDAAKTEADQTIENLRDAVKTTNIAVSGFDRNDPQTLQDTDSIQINIHGVDQTKTQAFRSLIADKYPDWILTPVNATDYKMNLKPSALIDLKRNTVAQERDTIERRVNALGLTEPTVQDYGSSEKESEILVELPDIDDPAAVKDLIGSVAQLKIVEVKNEGPWKSKEEGLAAKGGILPLGTELLDWPAGIGNATGSWYLVSRTPVITGQDMRNAREATDTDSPGRWECNFTLSQDGARRFGAFTGSNIGNRLAVVLDNQITSVATIQSRIDDSGRINGLATQEEAHDLALKLRTGALPAGIKYEQERTIGPSLGADSIREGIVAAIAGLLAVIVVMLVYYKKAGINAVLALLLNTVLLMAALAYFGATLTLPGIAGVILTIGMAVDSNVLIFERIREELRSGKSIPASVDAGFGKAWWTIVDTHVTTIVSCLFLFMFGTGPVRGFAVTLVIGLLANVFTAVFVSKVIFDWELSGRRQVEVLSI